MAARLVEGSLPVGWCWQGRAAPSTGMGAPALLLIPPSAGELAGKTKQRRIPFWVDQQTRLADCVAAWLLVLARSDRGVCVCQCKHHACVLGTGKVVLVGTRSRETTAHSLNEPNCTLDSDSMR